MMHTKLLPLSMIAAMALQSAYAEDTTELDPIVVSSDFREKKLSETSNAVTVIGEDEVYDKASQSFIETLATTPNVNFTTGASKAKFIQIRGIGERGQYQYPLNPSVGLMVDGVDFSYISLGASMFDVKQIEVLRGPQGTTFGANGLAGVVSVQSNAPARETEGHIKATVGNYNTKAYGAAVGGEISENLLGRFSIYKNTSDSFMKNSTYNRDDTNNIDELIAKTQLRWFVSENHTIDVKYTHIDINNGYDAFTLDNSWVSKADEPGKDKQKTDALFIQSHYAFDTMHWITKLEGSKSDILYKYDNDWSYVGAIEDGVEQYSGSDSYDREYKNWSIDTKLLSDDAHKIFGGTTDWTLGLYHKKQNQKLARLERYEEWYTPLNSTYDTKSTALYGQLNTQINSKLSLVTGLRVEQWEATYSDDNNDNLKYDETIAGGKIGLNYQINPNDLMYITLSRGYKPGGFNIENLLTDVDTTSYDTEYLWNLEAGYNSSHFEGKLLSRLNLFYSKRKDIQIGTDIQIEDSYETYISNASSGHSYGLESSLVFLATDNLQLYSNIGLLKTKFDEYNNQNEDAYDIEDRAFAQAPAYQYDIGLRYNLSENLFIKSNMTGRDNFYFSDGHGQKAEAYNLLNASIEYIRGNWSAILWGKNLTDKEYATRGFYWANTPADDWGNTKLYTQKGVPRTFGLTVSYDF